MRRGTTADVDLSHIETEADFTRWFLNVASMFGWHRRYHTYRSKRSHTGFPDWVLVHPTLGVVFAELKGAHTPIQPDQQAWHDELTEAGADAYIWRPADGAAVVERLSGVRQVRP